MACARTVTAVLICAASSCARATARSSRVFTAAMSISGSGRFSSFGFGSGCEMTVISRTALVFRIL